MVDGAGRGRGAHPFTAPWVRPETIWRWNSTTRMTTGMVTTTAAAEIAPVGSSKYDAPVKNASAAGTGRAALVDVPTVVMALVAAFLLIRFKASSAWIVLGGAAAGAVVHAFR